MGTPRYPEDWSSRIQRIEKGARDAMTAARTRVRYAKVAAASLVVGTLTGRQIIINPDDSSQPVVRFIPEGNGSGWAQIWGRSDPDDPTLARLFINTNGDTIGYGQVRVDRDRIYLSMFDANDNAAGGALDLDRGAARVGMVYTPTQAMVGFLADGATYHMGRWPNFVDWGAQQGIFSGQVLQSTGSGGAWTDLAIGYGATRPAAPVVVATIKNTGAQPPFAHLVAAESTTGFTIRVEGSHAFYANFWCFRV